MPKPPTPVWDRNDKTQSAVTIIGAALSVAALALQLPWSLGWIGVAIANGYLVVMLVLAALRKPDLIPNRWPAFFILPSVFIMIVCGFAMLYVGSDAVQKTEMASGPFGLVILKQPETLHNPLEAAYFSFATLTTSGSDFAPSNGYAQFLVTLEICSGLIFLASAFPILINRVAMFEAADTPKPVFIRVERDSLKWSLPESVSGGADALELEVKQEADGNITVRPAAPPPKPKLPEGEGVGKPGDGVAPAAAPGTGQAVTPAPKKPA